MIQTIRNFLLVCCGALFIAPHAVVAEFVVPPMHGPVVDQAGLLSASDRQTLSDLLINLYQSGGSQIGVLTVSSLEGSAIEEVAIKTADAWKLGRQDRDDGILLVVAPNDRRVRIEVGRGREGDLTDAYSRRIINQVMTPAFKSGKFGEGIFSGVAAIIQKSDPTFNLEAAGMRPVKVRHRGGQNISPVAFWILFIGFFVVFGPIMMILNALGLASRQHGMRSYHSHTRGGGWSGGSGRSSGGGWSGGGGSFGGGGSSGSW